MNFIWAKTDNAKNSQLVFNLNLDKKCDLLTVCAVDTYRVFVNDKFISFGPERTAKGYVRKKTIRLTNAKEIRITVMGYGVPNYCVAYQNPFFGAEVTYNGKKVYGTEDFKCYIDLSRMTNMPHYSLQRFFVEGYDYRKSGFQEIETRPVTSPTIIEGVGETCEYQVLPMNYIKNGNFNGLERLYEKPWWYKLEHVKPVESDFRVIEDFLEKTKTGYQYIDYVLDEEHSGFIKLDINAKETTEIFVVFDEIMMDGVWKFFRSACNDLIVITAEKGKTNFLSCEPYTFKHLKIIYKGEAIFSPSIVKFENDVASCVKFDGNQQLKEIFDAAESSFRQNCVDIFTDCPGRERAGYLCDSFFMAKAERFFFGTNKIEKNFLENYILSSNEEIPEKMLPMCYPAHFFDGTFIPNWSLFFIIQLYDYFKRTGDYVLCKKAKNKALEVLDYFKKYENEYGLLENLEGWVFVEWSISNDDEYIKGVNFPSNMIYAQALRCVGQLFGMPAFLKKSKELFLTIENMSFNGEFFVDNAIRIDGKLTPCDNHISETCQYYALFTGIYPNIQFANRMKNNFGSCECEKFGYVGKSNMFIGYYLRLMWLCSIGEKDRVIEDSIKYFSNMAKETKTLWEKDSNEASCCHGFTSVIAPLLANCLVGYDEYNNNLSSINGVYENKNYNVSLEFNY